MNSQKNEIIPEETSKRISSLRFLLAILVVFIHNNFTVKNIAEDIEAGSQPVVFTENLFGEFVQRLISSNLASCAVPLFFLFAAYLLSRKNDSYKNLLYKKSKSLVLPYVLWLLIYFFVCGFVKILISKFLPSLFANPDRNAFSIQIKDYIEGFIGFYTGRGDGNPRFAMQFWFVRDLIIFTFLSPVFTFFIKKFPAAVLSVVSVFYLSGSFPLDAHLPYAVFFYFTGLYWGIFNINIFEKADKIKWSEIIFFFLFTIILQYVFPEITVLSRFTTLADCVLLLKFSGIIIKNDKAFSIFSYLSGFSFWLYAIHMPVLNSIVQKIWIKLFPMKNTFFALFEYFGATLIVITAGTFLGIAVKKVCPKLFALLTGGRS